MARVEQTETPQMMEERVKRSELPLSFQPAYIEKFATEVNGFKYVQYVCLSTQPALPSYIALVTQGCLELCGNCGFSDMLCKVSVVHNFCTVC